MKYVKLMSFLVMILLITAFKEPETGGTLAANSPCKAKITIHGSTNVNQFELSNNLSQITIRSCQHSYDSAAMLTKKYWLQIPVKNFRTEHKQIYKDFLTLTKAHRYPDIRLGLLLADLHKLMGMNKSVTFPVDVTMAGVTKTFRVTCKVSACTDQCISVSGSHKMHLTDFNINPPEKILGLIRVNNEILVNFGFVISVQ